MTQGKLQAQPVPSSHLELLRKLSIVSPGTNPVYLFLDEIDIQYGYDAYSGKIYIKVTLKEV